MRDIDPKTLRLFVAVCDCRSMARAAEQERIEPSAISKRIAQLEDDLGVELLTRNRRGVQTTPAGLALLENARTVLFTMDRIAADAAAFRGGGLQAHVRLVATASALAEGLLDDIASFLREPGHENLRIDLEERPARDLVREVRDGIASVGVGWDGIDFEGLARRPYRRDRLALAVYAGHSLAGRTTPIGFEETLAFEHVGLPPSTEVHTLLQRAAARAGRTVTYRVVVSGFDAALRAVAANLGVSVVPVALGQRSAVSADLQLIALSDAWAERRFAICCRDFESLPPASRRLVDHLLARAAEGAVAT